MDEGFGPSGGPATEDRLAAALDRWAATVSTTPDYGAALVDTVTDRAPGGPVRATVRTRRLSTPLMAAVVVALVAGVVAVVHGLRATPHRHAASTVRVCPVDAAALRRSLARTTVTVDGDPARVLAAGSDGTMLTAWAGDTRVGFTSPDRSTVVVWRAPAGPNWQIVANPWGAVGPNFATFLARSGSGALHVVVVTRSDLSTSDLAPGPGYAADTTAPGTAPVVTGDFAEFLEHRVADRRAFLALTELGTGDKQPLSRSSAAGLRAILPVAGATARLAGGVIHVDDPDSATHRAFPVGPTGSVSSDRSDLRWLTGGTAATWSIGDLAPHRAALPPAVRGGRLIGPYVVTAGPRQVVLVPGSRHPARLPSGTRLVAAVGSAAVLQIAGGGTVRESVVPASTLAAETTCG